MALIDQMLEELRTLLPTLAFPLEGALDYGRVNLNAPAKAVAEQGRQSLALWKNRVEASINALQLLKDIGYPDLPSFETETDVLADLDVQIATMQAFRARVKKKVSPAVDIKENPFGNPVPDR